MKFLSCWNGFQCSLLKFHKEKTSALVPFRSQGARTRISEAREHKNRYIFAAIRFPQNKRNDIVAFPFYTSPSQKGVPGKEILLTRQALTSSVWFFKNLISNSQRPDYCLRNREILWPTFNSLPDWLKILSNRFTALSFCSLQVLVLTESLLWTQSWTQGICLHFGILQPRSLHCNRTSCCTRVWSLLNVLQAPELTKCWFFPTLLKKYRTALC